MIDTIVAIVVVASIGLVLMVVWPACVVSGRISELERRQETLSRPGFAQGADGASECPIDNNRLSLGDRIEDDNAD